MPGEARGVADAKGPGFLRELKRRHVWRVAAAYAITGWLLVQVATQLFPFFSIPNWAVRMVVVLVVIGFPVAVICAWAYEIAPEGIRRPDEAQRNPGSVLPDTAAAAASTTQFAPAKSVAVLPFANESGNKDEQFFSDGLSEDLINALSQFDGLKVISRSSAFQFRDSTETADAIGRKLGVAHLLEGSVQRSGEQVRITATLVNAAEGSIIWSQHYDRPFKDLFSLQDDITRAVADAFKARFVTAPGAVVQSDRPPSGNLAAYTAYQRGMAFGALTTATEDGTRRAIEAFGEAIRLDPQYAAAHARLAAQWLELLDWGVSAAQVHTKAREALNTALRLDPDSSLAHQVRAQFLLRTDVDWADAVAEARRALQLAPNDPDAKIQLANMLRRLGQIQRALVLTRQALDSNPRNASWNRWLGVDLLSLGCLDEARQATLAAIALLPGGPTFHTLLAVIETLRGDAKAALAAAQQESIPAWRAWALAIASQIGPDRAVADSALQRLMDDYADSFAFPVAEVFALRRDPDQMFKWLDHAWAVRDPGVGFLLVDPLILRYRRDPRFAAFCEKVGLPTTTDAVAMK